MLRAAGLLVLLSAPAVAAPDFSTQRYSCDRGVEVPATYVTTVDGGLVVLQIEGRQITLLEEPAASGVRYGWPSDGPAYVWWTKGDEATLFWNTPDSEAPILTCAAMG
jgi:membrane-bound inhibitor of C-type lysozyme